MGSNTSLAGVVLMLALPALADASGSVSSYTTRRLVEQHHETTCQACCACKAITTEDARLQYAGTRPGAQRQSERELCTYNRCDGSSKWYCWDTYVKSNIRAKWGKACRTVAGYPACTSGCAFSASQAARQQDDVGEFQTWNHDSHLEFGGRTGGPIQVQDDDDAY